MQANVEATRESLLDTLQLLGAIELKRTRNRFASMYPEHGPLRRDLYPKHQAFFALGATKRFRLLMGPNGIGKTEGVGGYEVVCHLTGLYPDWWTGKRFHRAIKAWCAGDTNKTLRESIQPKLLGDEGNHGTGLIPFDLLGTVKVKQNTNGVIDYVLVKHVPTGKWSRLVFKSYEEGRESFQASDVDLIWLDEEPKSNIMTECVHRFRGRTADGHMLLTFTPVNGISDVVCLFVPQFIEGFDQAEYDLASKGYVHCSLDEVAHMTPEERRAKEAATPPWEREARINGLPSIGSGKIYPVEERTFLVDPFRIPDHWERAFGFDGGYHHTAAVWGAYDKDNDTWYLYGEYKPGEGPVALHATAIKLRGEWIPGVGDAAAISQTDGSKMLDLYRALGVDLTLADKEVGKGLAMVLDLLLTGKLKVFSNLKQWLDEFRLYRFDEKHRVVKVKDHLMDATRYLIMSGLKVATTPQRKSAMTFRPVNFG